MRLRLFFFSICAFMAILTEKAYAQGEPIHLTNPSFEDIPRYSRPPVGWFDCAKNFGFKGETPPDTQPSGAFSVSKAPYDGSTYLGMVVRDNDTWESVSQRLSKPMQKGQCYEFSIYIPLTCLTSVASKPIGTSADESIAVVD